MPQKAKTSKRSTRDKAKRKRYLADKRWNRNKASRILRKARGIRKIAPAAWLKKILTRDRTMKTEVKLEVIKLANKKLKAGLPESLAYKNT